MKDESIKNEDDIQKLDEELSDLESTEISGGYDDKNYFQCGCQNSKCGT